MLNMHVVVRIVTVLHIVLYYMLFVNSYTSADCVDTFPNCTLYGPASCGGPFQSWARHHCANYCHYCPGPTTPAPACVDVADDCDTYIRSSCNDPRYSNWAHEKCRYFCRLCPEPVLTVVDASTTTLSPENCVDKLDCKLYDKSTCGGNYLHWARSNCPAYCNFCKPLPTPLHPCHDMLPNCSMYVSAICNNDLFLRWTKEHCRKFCKMC